MAAWYNTYMRRVISVANQKGGVGKTTTAINLSSSLAHFGKSVLLIDMDPQGNSSRGVGIDIALLNRTIFDVLSGKSEISKVVRKTSVNNLEVLPANLKLASIDSVLRGLDRPLFTLKLRLDNLKKDYDYIIIDCPPSLGLLNLNALVASNSVIIPVQCEYFAMDAVAQILASISNVQSSFNQSLGIEGFLLTMFDSRTTLGVEIAKEVRSVFKEKTFISQIPRNVALPEASRYGIPVILHKPTSTGSLAYLNLAKEIIDNERNEA